MRAGKPSQAEAEIVHGLRAGLAVFARRRDEIVRIAHAPVARKDVAALTRWAMSHDVPCVEMRDRELDRFGGSTQNEGLCVVARPRRWLSTNELGEALIRAGGMAVALDRVRNPYNVGAVLRTAAFFGLRAALLGAPAPHPGLAPTAVRVAEGGVEHLQLARTTDLAATLSRLRSRGIRVVGAVAGTKSSEVAFASASASVLVMGNEREGLGARVRAECDELITISGSGAIESLNIAVAAGVLIAAAAKKIVGKII
ncbi:MAG: RNA methyltransferase [Myxococcota bacterium]|nr:RNA methyltransferase [Myxococcota bacterium]